MRPLATGGDSVLPVRISRIERSRSSSVKVAVGAGERCAIVTDRLMRVASTKFGIWQDASWISNSTITGQDEVRVMISAA